MHAQDTYPEKPVQVVLPLQVGSASDIAVRVLVEKLGENLKQSFLVENVTGAAGLIGADRLAKAGPILRRAVPAECYARWRQRCGTTAWRLLEEVVGKLH